MKIKENRCRPGGCESGVFRRLWALALAGLLVCAPLAGCGSTDAAKDMGDSGELAGEPADGEAEGDTASDGADGAQSGANGSDADGSNAEAGRLSKPEIDPDDPYLLLVNKTHPLDDTYKPDDLADIKYFAADRDAAARYMRKEAAEHFHQMSEAAAVEGHEIVITTAYRSYGFQSVLWNNYVEKHGEAEANTFSARPGQSEHQTGLCTDVSSPSVNYQLTTDYADTEEGRWLAEHCHEYGFIIRFPLGKEEITGYQYEPWHIRYVGTEAAAYIHQEQITLEEYLNVLD